MSTSQLLMLGCWIIKMDVPVETTFEPEDSELCDTIFETTLLLNGDYMDTT